MPARKDVNERISLATVRDAYLRGDFERCLNLCDAYRARDEHDEVAVELFRARALMPLNRADGALDALQRLRLVEAPRDEQLVARMLTGGAYVKLGQTDRGLELLKGAYEDSTSAHPTVRADLAVNLGIARYGKRQFSQAFQVLMSVPEEADIIHARALLYMAWTAWGQADYATAADRFESTLRRIDACRNYDRYVEAYALYGYALLCAELPRLHLWSEIRGRVDRFDWTVSGLALPRFWLSIAASYVTEMLGTLDEARGLAAEAEVEAPSTSCRIVAWCRLAALFGPYGERAAHGFFVGKARREYDRLGREDRLRDEFYLPLTLAEEVVQTSAPDQAHALLTYYREAQAPLLKEHPDEPKLEAHFCAIEGALYQARGQRAVAHRRYVSAWDRFRAMGFGRSASIVASRLVRLTGDEHFRTFATKALGDVHAGYWVKQQLGAQPVDVPLTANQSDVLRLVSEGLTNKQIAEARGISFFRARNVVADLLAAFGAKNRVELGHVAVKLGLIAARHAQNPTEVG